MTSVTPRVTVVIAIALSLSLASTARAEKPVTEKAGFQLTPQMRAAMDAPGRETPLAWLGNAIRYQYQNDPMSIDVGQKYRLPEARSSCAAGDTDACATARGIEKWLAWAKSVPRQGLAACDRTPCDRIPGALVPPALKGKPWILHAWASWCPYCRLDHQRLVDIGTTRNNALVSLLFQDSENAARDFLSSQGNPYGGGRIPASRDLLNRLDLHAVPATYLIGPEGNVVRRFQGSLDDNGQEALEKHLN